MLRKRKFIMAKRVHDHPNPHSTPTGQLWKFRGGLIMQVVFVVVASLLWWNYSPTAEVGDREIPVGWLLPIWGMVMAISIFTRTNAIAIAIPATDKKSGNVEHNL